MLINKQKQHGKIITSCHTEKDVAIKIVFTSPRKKMASISSLED